MLNPLTLLRLENNSQRVRLSYILQDDSGIKKGLTVAALLIDTSSSLGVSALTHEKDSFKVYNEDEIVGIVDPYVNMWASTEFSYGIPPNKTIFKSGILTRVLTLASDVEFDQLYVPDFPRKIAQLEQCAEQEVRILGESEIGVLETDVFYMATEDASIYPLYSVERSRDDLSKKSIPIRNGAMITTCSDELLGVIVSLYDDNTRYGIAPIGDILDWHKLSFLSKEGTLTPASEPGSVSVGDPISPRAKGRRSPKTWDPQLQNLLRGERL